MATKPKVSSAAEEHIVHINPGLVWGPRCLATDIAVGGWDYSEFFLEQDAATQSKMVAVRLQAEANVHKAVADANAEMAKVIKQGG
jgi:hypothetical protein